MIKLTFHDFMNISSMIIDAAEQFERYEHKEINPNMSEIIVHDKDFKGERKIDIGLIAG